MPITATTLAEFEAHKPKAVKTYKHDNPASPVVENIVMPEGDNYARYNLEAVEESTNRDVYKSWGLNKRTPVFHITPEQQ